MKGLFKKCTKCKKRKLITNFYKNKNSTDGLTHTCKNCNKVQANDWYSDNIERARKRSREYQATHPKKEGYLDYLRNYYQKNKDAAQQYGKEWRAKNSERKKAADKKWAAENKEKVLEIKRRWRNKNKEKTQVARRERYAANPEKELVKSQEWRKNNPEKTTAYARNRRARVIGNGGEITKEEWQALKEFYDYTCLGCKRKEPEIKLELDHVVPIVKGGKNVILNAQPLCRTCNLRKGARIIDYR